MDKNKPAAMNINVSVTDTEVFKDMLVVIHKVVMDDRMPADLRGDAIAWFKGAGIHDREYAIFMDHTVKPMTTLDATGWPVKIAPYQAKELIIILCDNVHLGEVLWDRIKHKYNANSRVRFIGSGSRNMDGLRPDKVVRLRGWEESAGALMKWLTLDGNKSEVIDETGDHG